jgi:sulfur relay (sulfurtransferase) DsrC/TusE family protein
MNWKEIQNNMRDNKTSAYVNSVFEQPWWLDVVAPNVWKEILVEEEGEIVARWPIVNKGNCIGMPEMTQTLGFWLSDKILDSDPFYNKRKKITNLLLEQLPRNKRIKISLDHKIDYFLPMHWKNYIISPLISYRIKNMTDVDAIYDLFNKRVKENIKMANSKVIVKTIDDIELLLMLIDKTFSIQNRKFPISKDLIRNIYSACKDYNAGKLLYAIDKDNNAYSGALFVYDKNICYYLLSGTDPKYRSSGANTLLTWEGIKFASTVSKSFDFEGSMIEGIENFLKQFGGKLIVYYQIRKQNIFLEFFELLKPRIKSLIGYKQ